MGRLPAGPPVLGREGYNSGWHFFNHHLRSILNNKCSAVRDGVAIFLRSLNVFSVVLEIDDPSKITNMIFRVLTRMTESRWRRV